MTLKKAAGAVGSALLYFGIYFAWQFVVGFWVGLAYEAYALAVYGVSADIPAMLVDFSLKYAVHMTLVSNVLALVTFTVLFRMRKRSLLDEVRLTKLSPTVCGVCLLFGAAMNIFVTVVISSVPFPEAWWDQYNSMASAIPGSAAWISVLSTVIAAPIVEEIVLRGLFYGRLKRGMPMFAAMLISSWIFGLIHGAAIWVIYASLLGMLIAWIYEKYRSLTAAVLFHFGFNLCGFILGYFENLPMLIIILSAVISVGLLAYIQLSAPGKIEFTVPKGNIASTGDGDTEN